MADHYKIVPKEIHANLAFRRECCDRAKASKDDALDLWHMCATDILFYLNTFAFTYDPRYHPNCPERPFITYDYQDAVIVDLEASIGYEDRAFEKSREMGASWMILYAYDFRYRFRELQTFLLVSRAEQYVDKKNEPDSLFWKIDFHRKRLPGFLTPNEERQKLSLANLDNGSTITGASTTTEVGRGGRKTAIMLDEFAMVPDGHPMLNATQHATSSRAINSTPKGAGNAFYDIIHKTQIKKFRLHWTQHPEKSKGLYHDSNGKARSPWYDGECARAPHPAWIGQELDIDYHGSDTVFFEADLIDRVLAECCRPELFRGELEYDPQSAHPHGLSQTSSGRLRLWCGRHPDGSVSKETRYVVGADVSAGTGASNSVLSAWDRRTHEQVGEWCCPNTRPEQAGRIAVALCRFFKGSDNMGALLIWEANGPGRNFGDAVLESGYSNIYYRTTDKKSTKTVTDFPGWWSSPEEKTALFGNYRRMLQDRKASPRSKDQMEECRLYVFTTNSTVEHSGALNAQDPSGARENHGDRPTAAALCCKVIGDSGLPKPEAAPIPPGSLLARMHDARREAMAAKTW